jgi:hypothetical protein
VPSAATDLQLDFLGLSAACADGKKHGCEPVFGRRALYGSCQAGEPGNTCVLRLRRRTDSTLPLFRSTLSTATFSGRWTDGIRTFSL